VSNKDKKAAELLLLAQRAADPNYKPPSGLKRTFSRPKPTDPPVFDYNEVNRGLDAAVISEASVGVVKALLLLGGNVNIIRQVPVSLVKKFSNKGQVGERSNLMRKAATYCLLGLVEFLAGEADQQSLDEALVAALHRADLRIVKLLLEFGQNLETYHNEFQSIVQSKAEDMVEMLVVAPKPPCKSYHDVALDIAVNIKSQRILSVLAFTKADADCQNAKALQYAVAVNNRAFALTILLSCQPPSVRSLDIAIPQTYSKIARGESEETVTELLEILLCGGGVGPYTDEILLKTV
jgi:hypothetical protein